MRLERITLRNFRGVKESTVEFGPGVTVVAGPNEVGKSSIAEAIRVLRQRKHSSTAGDVRALQPVGKDVGPEVELEFTSRDHRVWVRKQWLRSAATELRISGASNEQHAGDEAHERLNSFLAEHIDVELFDALSIVQGESLEKAAFVQLRALTQALDTNAEPGADHDDLLEKINTEYELHFSPATGKPRGRLSQLGKEVAALKGELSKAEERLQEMEQFTTGVERESRQLDLDERACVEAREALEAATAKDTALASLRTAAEQAASQLDAAVTAAEQVTAALEARKQQVTEVAQREESLAQARRLLAEAQEALIEINAAGEEATRLRETALAEAAEAKRAHRAATKELDRARDHEELAAISRRLANARTAQERRLQAITTIGNTHVDATLLEEIITRTADLNVAISAQEAAAATIRMHVLSDAEVLLDNRAVTETREVTVTDPLVVEAPGVLRVEVHPGALPQDVAANVERAQQRLEESLARGQVDDLAEAREAANRRAEAEAERSLADQALHAALGEQTLEELSELRSILSTKLGEPEQPEKHTADLEELRDLLVAATTRLEEAEAKLTQAQEAYDTHAKRVSEVREVLIRAQSDVESAEAELTRAQKTLQEVRAATSDEDLERQLRLAVERQEQARLTHSEAEEKLAAANPEAIAMELANAKDWNESAGKRLDDTRARLERFKGLVEDRTADGLYDASREIEAQLNAAANEYDRLEARAQAAKLLHETIHRHRDAAHARYVAPFAQQIENLGHIVFGAGFSVEIAPDLSIKSRTLNDQTIPFEDLSAGAKEQLGLLGRLAATTLVDPLEGAPLILDDTLGFADEERLGALNAVLNDVGKTAQIIVLTCQPQRFARVGGADIVHLSAQVDL